MFLPAYYNRSIMNNKNSILTKREIIAEIVEDAYVKSYKMRMVGAGSSLEATIPRAVVEREARGHGLSVPEFIKLYQVEYRFNDFGGAFLGFKRQSNEDENT